jgi:hypothetical protein
MRQAVLDGEGGAEAGMESIQAVGEARGPADPAAAFVAFDPLQLEGETLRTEPWRARRMPLEGLSHGFACFRVGLLPVSTEPPRLSDLWTAWAARGSSSRIRSHPPNRGPGPRRG